MANYYDDAVKSNFEMFIYSGHRRGAGTRVCVCKRDGCGFDSHIGERKEFDGSSFSSATQDAILKNSAERDERS